MTKNNFITYGLAVLFVTFMSQVTLGAAFSGNYVLAWGFEDSILSFLHNLFCCMVFSIFILALILQKTDQLHTVHEHVFLCLYEY